MCGIAGYLLRAPSGDVRDIRTLLSGIVRRGPDDQGIYLTDRVRDQSSTWATECSADAVRADRPLLPHAGAIPPHDLALVHTRYAIVDLSPGGHQPFQSRDRTITAVFNGEIYNYLELRRTLEGAGVGFRTTSDTEVLVEGYLHWGEALWPRLNGFWAVALYDRRSATLTLARDRLGVAPLYLRDMQTGFYFASAIRPLIAVAPEGIHRDADRVLGFIDTGMKDLDDSTFYHEIRSLPPATVVAIGPATTRPAAALTRPYWTPPSRRLTVRDLSLAEAAAELRTRLVEAVELRLRADVEVACELSGGMDSSSIVAAAAMLRERPITTFTIKVPAHDEEPIARTILTRHRLDYRVLEQPEEDFLADAHWFSGIMEEPYHSPNIYTHFQMRRRMKAGGAFVALAGAGGDEVLAGYEHLFWPQAAAELRNTGRAAQADAYDRARGSHRPLSRRERLSAAWWGARRKVIRGAKQLLGRPLDPPSPEGLQAPEYAARYPSLAFHQQQLYHLRVAMLPYYLRSNDHFTMTIPLEARYPLLDYRVVELGLQMPIPYLFRDGYTKYVLRRAMEAHLPPEIVWRRDKMGFPFDYREFLTRRRVELERVLRQLAVLGISVDTYGGYDALVAGEPIKAWRLCSTAIWVGGDEEIGVPPPATPAVSPL